MAVCMPHSALCWGREVPHSSCWQEAQHKACQGRAMLWGVCPMLQAQG